jgi:hypothetical protein
MGHANDAAQGDLTEQHAPGTGAVQQRDPSEPDATGAEPAQPGAEVMDLLAEHVPLALLADLAAPSDVVSTQILESEGLPDDPWWEDPADAPITLRPNPGQVSSDPAGADDGEESGTG